MKFEQDSLAAVEGSDLFRYAYENLYPILKTFIVRETLKKAPVDYARCKVEKTPLYLKLYFLIMAIVLHAWFFTIAYRSITGQR